MDKKYQMLFNGRSLKYDCHIEDNDEYGSEFVFDNLSVNGATVNVTDWPAIKAALGYDPDESWEWIIRGVHSAHWDEQKRLGAEKVRGIYKQAQRYLDRWVEAHRTSGAPVRIGQDIGFRWSPKKAAKVAALMDAVMQDNGWTSDKDAPCRLGPCDNAAFEVNKWLACAGLPNGSWSRTAILFAYGINPESMRPPQPHPALDFSGKESEIV